MQHPAADLRFDHVRRFPRQCRGPSELDPTAFERLEHPVEDAAMVVQVAIERSTETVDEAHRPEAGPCRGPCTAFPQMGLDDPQEDMQHRSDRLWLPFQVPAQSLGDGQHPLPDRQGREDVIDQVGGGLDHAPGIARRADAAALAGEGHQEVVATLGTAGAGEAVGQDAALEIASEFALHVAGYRVPIAVAFARQREVGLQVLLDRSDVGAIEGGLLGATTGVESRAASLWTGGHVGDKA